jgi:hypothetical protein
MLHQLTCPNRATHSSKYRALMIVCLLTIYFSNAHAVGTLSVGFAGPTGSSCQQTTNFDLIVGSAVRIVVAINDPDREYHGLKDTPPSGLQLEFCLKRELSDPFVASSEIYERLSPQYYVTTRQKEVAERWLNGIAPHRLDKIEKYHYLIEIPEDFAGQVLCIRAQLNNAEYGMLNTLEEARGETNVKCVNVVEPCSDEDRGFAAATFIRFADDAGYFERAIQIGDSLVATGWADKWGFMWVRQSAIKVNRWTTALEYLDRLYNIYGMTEVFSGAVSGSQSEYERLRTQYSQKIAEQEQQNH